MLSNNALADDTACYLERIRFNCMFLALGKDTPWDVESNPPKPGPNVDDLLEPLAFIRIEELAPIYSDAEGDLKAGLSRYKKLHNPTRDQILDYQAFKIFASTTVQHKRLNFPSFREAALIKVESTRPGVDLNENRVFTTDQILSYNLEVYKTFPPKTVASTVEETIGLIRPI